MDLITAVSLLFCNNDFPTLAQGVGLALLTILIPVAIGIFSGDKDFKELDNHVILDHVIKAKWLLVYAAFIFIPVIFWQYSDMSLRFVELGIWILGLALLVKSLFLSYKWLKGNKFPLRLDYLRSITNSQDLEESWRSVWSNEGVNAQNDNDFFTIFQSHIERLLRNNE